MGLLSRRLPPAQLVLQPHSTRGSSLGLTHRAPLLLMAGLILLLVVNLAFLRGSVRLGGPAAACTCAVS